MTISTDKLSHLLDIFDGSTLAPGLALANRNYIIDGKFETFVSTATVSQSGAATNSASAAMYYFYPGTAGVLTSTAFSLTDALTGSEPIGMHLPVTGGVTLNQTTASTGSVASSTAAGFWQDVEDVRVGNGRSQTFSCWLWTTSGTVTITNLVQRQSFGSGTNSPSANVVIDKAINWTVTTTPQRFSVRVDWPSIAGLTIGNTGNSYLQIGLWFPNQTFTVKTTQWQLEDSPATSSSNITGSGGLPTMYEYRGIQLEAARTARYWQRLSGGGPYGAGFYTSTTIGAYSIPYPDGPMRAAPSVSFSGTFQCSIPANNLAPSAMTSVLQSAGSTAIFANATVSGATAGQGSVLWGLSGSSITFDARV
jgi:hypothetical protein